MAIGTVTWGTIVGTNGSAPAPAHPSPAAGDLLLAVFYSYLASGGAVTTPSNWSVLIASTQTANGLYAVFYKLADGTESTGTLSIAYTGGSSGTSGSTALGVIGKVPGGWSGATPLSGTATPETEAASQASYTNAGVSPVDAGSLIVLVTGIRDCATNNEAPFSTWADSDAATGAWAGTSLGTTSGSDAGLGVGSVVKSNTGATGNITVAVLGGGSSAPSTATGISCSFAIKAAPTPTGTLASLTGTGALSIAPGAPAHSVAAPDMTGTGALGTATGTAALTSTDHSGTVADLTGTAALSTAAGAQGTAVPVIGALSGPVTAGAALTVAGIVGPTDHSGTVADLAGTGALGTATGTAAAPTVHSGTVLDLTGTATLGTATGAAALVEARSGTCASLTGTASPGTATGTAALLPITPTPTVNALSGPVTVGATLTVTGTVPAGSSDRTGTAATLSGSASLGTAAGTRSVVVALPATLNGPLYSALTGTLSGNDVVMTAGQYVEFQIDAGAGGTFDLAALIAGASGASATLAIDGVTQATWAVP